MKSSRKIQDQLLLEKKTDGLSGVQLAQFFHCSPAAISKRLRRLVPRQPSALDALTPQRAEVVKRVVAGESGTNAVAQCYNTRASAREIARKILASPEVQLALVEEMDRVGLTKNYRVERLAELCGHPDPSIAMKALEMAFRIADDFPAAKSKSLMISAEVSPHRPQRVSTLRHHGTR